MKNYNEELGIKLHDIDWYEFGYNKNTSKYAASECLIALLNRNNPIGKSITYIIDLLSDEEEHTD